MVREGRRRIPPRPCSLQRPRHTLPRMLCTPSRRRRCTCRHSASKSTDGGGRTTAHKRSTCVQQGGGRSRPRTAAACPHERSARYARRHHTCNLHKSVRQMIKVNSRVSFVGTDCLSLCAEFKRKGAEGSFPATKIHLILTSSSRPLGCPLVCVWSTAPCGRVCLRCLWVRLAR